MTVYLPDENATSLMHPPPYREFEDEGASIQGMHVRPTPGLV